MGFDDDGKGVEHLQASGWRSLSQYGVKEEPKKKRAAPADKEAKKLDKSLEKIGNVRIWSMKKWFLVVFWLFFGCFYVILWHFLVFFSLSFHYFFVIFHYFFVIFHYFFVIFHYFFFTFALFSFFLLILASHQIFKEKYNRPDLVPKSKEEIAEENAGTSQSIMSDKRAEERASNKKRRL